MAGVEGRRDPTSLALLAISRRECDRFRHRNLRRPGRGRRVHAVELRPWIGGLWLPGPACHQPFDALALAGASEAVRAAVDCVRCLSGGPDLYGALVPVDGGQLPLEFERA
jgi:hypothetical protein